MRTTPVRIALLVALTFTMIEIQPAISRAQESQANLPSPPSLTPKQWEEDLDTLISNVPRLHGNAFHVVSEKDFLAEAGFLRSRLQKTDQDQIVTGFVRLIGMIQDGHNYIDITGGSDRHECYPLRLAWFPDGIFVERAAPEAARLVGGRLVSIDDQPADSILHSVLPLVPHDPGNIGNAYTRLDQYILDAHLLHGLGVTTSANQAKFIVAKNGTLVAITLHPAGFSRRSFYQSAPPEWADARNGSEPRALWRQNRDSTFWMTCLRDYRTLYVQLNGVSDGSSESLAHFSERIADSVRQNQVARLVLDLRWNDGGNNYLLRPLIVSLIQMPEIDRRGHLIVLTGPRTFSAAQNLVNRLENFTEALFVGEPTGENVNFYGDTKRFVLPNSHFRISLANLWWQDKDPRDKRWATFPEIAVAETFEDYVQNRDPALDYVLHHEEIPTIEELVLRGSKEGGYAGALAAFRAFRSDPAHRYVDNDFLEGKINNLGYSLLGSNRIEDAILVFKVNTEMFPDSFNTWDSLGEAYANAGRKDEAITAYRKSLSLNPTSPTGLEALSRLVKR